MLEKTRSKVRRDLPERQRRIFNFLSGNSVGVLATVDPNGDPQASVIYYAIDTEFNVTFLTKKGTRKFDDLQRNNHTVLVVFQSATQTVAQIIGKANELTDNYDINNVAEEILRISLNSSEGGIPPIDKLEAGDYVAYEIKPSQIRMASYARPESGDYNKLFDSIESFTLNDS